MRKETPLAERFWPKVNKSGVNGCWVWTAAKNEKGYGKTGSDGGRAGRSLKAHRVAYELSLGPIPEGLCVLHKCDNPPCCNPDHLFLGTKAENNADMRAKKRDRRGETCPWTKLTDEDVKRIRALTGFRTQEDVAREYGIGRTYVSKIRTHKARHITNQQEYVP